MNKYVFQIWTDGVLPVVVCDTATLCVSVCVSVCPFRVCVLLFLPLL